MADDDDNGAGAAAAPPANPTTLDALGRELVAIRSLALAVANMCDAALTNYRLLQLQDASGSGLEPSAQRAAALERFGTLVDKMRGGGNAGGEFREFGGKAAADRAAAGDAGTADAGGTS